MRRFLDSDAAALPDPSNCTSGLTVREKFAESAMIGILAANRGSLDDGSAYLIAQNAIRCADALIAMLNQAGPGKTTYD